MNTLKAHPELVNSIAQKVGLRPPQFVAYCTQPLQSQETLVLNLCGQSAEPRQERARSILFLVKDDFRSGHSVLVYSQTCESANRKTARTGDRPGSAFAQLGDVQNSHLPPKAVNIKH